MIEIKNVSKTYKNGTHALYDVNLKVEDGEFVYIVGPTGSGKSTLIKLLDGEEIPTSGTVTVSGVNVGRLRKSKVYLYRRKIGVVFQDFRLLPDKNVFENISYALEVIDMPTDEIRKRVRHVLKLVGLSDKAKSKPHELSGGQQQRVSIARAIAKRPTILIADEPTGSLDPVTSNDIISLLEKINQEEKTTVLVVTHDNLMVKKHPKRIVAIESGHITKDIPYDPEKEARAKEKARAQALALEAKQKEAAAKAEAMRIAREEKMARTAELKAAKAAEKAAKEAAKAQVKEEN